MKDLVDSRARRTEVLVPFEALGPLPETVRQDLAREALRVNDRYLVEFLEKYAFCPYSQEGRARGIVSRYVHIFEESKVEPLVERMLEIADDPKQVVAQVIFPLIEVGPVEWRRFCHDLTALGHCRRGGRDALAVAPLHPELGFSPIRDEALIPLFRRTPDATIQWVRLDALADIYEGRGNGTRLVDAESLKRMLEQQMLGIERRERTPLWDRIAATNAVMARRLTLPIVEELLAKIADDARASYTRILLAGL